MSEQLDPVGALLTRVSTPWTPDRAGMIRGRIEGVLVRRKIARRFAAAALVVAAAGAGFLGKGAAPGSEIRFSDGSIARLNGAEDRLDIVEQSRNRTYVRLRGGAHFDVVPGRARRFAVDAGMVTVEVLGTAFSVEPRAGKVRVSVDHGKVRVAWAGGDRVLTTGQADLFPPHDIADPPINTSVPHITAEPGDLPPDDIAAEPAPATVRAKPRRSAGSWQRLAQSGQFDEAYRALENAITSEGQRAVPDEPDSLLLAADAARLSHHPQAALPHLERVTTRFRGDPRSSLAAFTMGLVLLEELGRPAEAARRFARSRALAPQGDLVEDALAREAEAHFKAGNRAGARAAATSYLRLYPQGRRALAVRRYGGLE